MSQEIGTESSEVNRLKMIRFEIMNMTSSRCVQQRSKAREKGLRSVRKLKLMGIPLRPGRSHWVSAEELSRNGGLVEELSRLEEAGRIVMKFDGNDINLAQAISMCAGQGRPKGPFYTTSYVGGSDALGGGRLSTTRLHRDVPFEVLEEELMFDDGLEEVVFPEESTTVVEPKVVHLSDISGLEFIADATEGDSHLAAYDDSSNHDDVLSFSESADFLGKSLSWVLAAVESGEIEPVEGTETITFGELTKVVVEPDDPGV